MDTLLHIGLGNAVLACLLALAAGAVSIMGRRPALAHGLWLLVLLKLVTPPLVHLPVPFFAPAATAPAAASPDTVATQPAAVSPRIVLVEADFMVPPDLPGLSPNSPDEAALPAPEPIETTATASPPATMAAAEPSPWTYLPVGLLSAWAFGSVAWLALMALRVQRFRRLLRHAKVAPAELEMQVAGLAERLGLARRPQVLLVPGPVSPMLWGFFGPPRLLIPVELLDRLDREQLGTLLAHELAHLRRRDHWVRLLELLATALYWWHPVVWYARRSLREAEEECCDAWVVWLLPAAAKSYAGALLETVNFLTDAVAVPPVASGVGQFPILKRRLTMIMRGTHPRSLSIAGLLGVLGLGIALLPWAPTWAQEDPDKPKPGIDRKEIEIEVQLKKDSPKPEEIERAKIEAKKLAEELDRARAHVREVEKRFLEVQHRLLQLTPGDKRILLLRDGHPVPMIEFSRDGKDFDIIIKRFEVELDKPGGEAAALKAKLDAKMSELKAAEKELDELRKNLDTIVRQLKDTDAGQAAAEALTRLARQKEAALQDRRAEVAELAARMKAVTFNVPVPPPPGARPGADGDRRLQDLERKLADLLREVQGLRQEMARPGVRTAPPPVPPTPPVPPAPPRR